MELNGIYYELWQNAEQQSKVYKDRAIELSACLEANREIVARVVPERNKLDAELRASLLDAGNFRTQLKAVIEQRDYLEKRLGQANDECHIRAKSEEGLRVELNEARAIVAKYAGASVNIHVQAMDAKSFSAAFTRDNLSKADCEAHGMYPAMPKVSGIKWAPPAPSVIHSAPGPYFKDGYSPDNGYIPDSADNNASAAQSLPKQKIGPGWHLEADSDGFRLVRMK